MKETLEGFRDRVPDLADKRPAVHGGRHEREMTFSVARIGIECETEDPHA